MFKYIMVFIFLCCLTGCYSLDKLAVENRMNALDLRLGMARDEVKLIMHSGDKMTYMSENPTVISEKQEFRLRTFLVFRKSFDNIKNPFKTDFFSNVSDNYIVDFYYIGKNDCDDDENLLPLVFKVDKNSDMTYLIGWGYAFLNNLQGRINDEMP